VIHLRTHAPQEGLQREVGSSRRVQELVRVNVDQPIHALRLHPSKHHTRGSRLRILRTELRKEICSVDVDKPVHALCLHPRPPSQAAQETGRTPNSGKQLLNPKSGADRTMDHVLCAVCCVLCAVCCVLCAVYGLCAVTTD